MVSLVSEIRIGVQLPEVEREVRWPEYVAMSQAAEEVGFDSMWAGDHLIYRDLNNQSAVHGRRGHCYRHWPV